MNDLDISILKMFNSIAHQSMIFDKAIVYLEGSNLFKGGIIVPMLWWVWFNKHDNENNKEYITATLMASLAAIALARTLALILPYRPRPVYSTLINFQVPFGLNSVGLDGWSSFPSDHAVFFFTLSTGLFLINRSVGCLALFYSFFAICLPRIYVGHHYPSDIIAGMLLGVGFGLIVRSETVRKISTARLLAWERKRPDYFYTCLFVFTAQMVFLFDPLRRIGKKVLSIVITLISSTFA